MNFLIQDDVMDAVWIISNKSKSCVVNSIFDIWTYITFQPSNAETINRRIWSEIMVGLQRKQIKCHFYAYLKTIMSHGYLIRTKDSARLLFSAASVARFFQSES